MASWRTSSEPSRGRTRRRTRASSIRPSVPAATASFPVSWTKRRGAKPRRSKSRLSAAGANRAVGASRLISRRNTVFWASDTAQSSQGLGGSGVAIHSRLPEASTALAKDPVGFAPHQTPITRAAPSGMPPSNIFNNGRTSSSTALAFFRDGTDGPPGLDEAMTHLLASGTRRTRSGLKREGEFSSTATSSGVMSSGRVSTAGSDMPPPARSVASLKASSRKKSSPAATKTSLVS